MNQTWVDYAIGLIVVTFLSFWCVFWGTVAICLGIKLVF